MTTLQAWVDSPVATALGWSLFHSLWQGAVVMAALAVCLWVARTAKVRYLAACLGMLAILCAFLFTFIRMYPGPNAGHVSLRLPPNGSWRAGIGAAGSGFSDANFSALVPWLSPLWLMGICFFAFRHAGGWWMVRRLRTEGTCNVAEVWQSAVTRLARELGISRPVLLLESALTEIPIVLGHFRPVILMPLGLLAGIPREQIEAILLHELAHVRRADYLVNLCQRLVESLLFYHPAVWWISRVIRTEREHCCDDVVVNLRGDALVYAKALTALESNRFSSREPALAATGGDLVKRVRRLLYPANQKAALAPVFAAILLIAGAVSVLAAWQEPPSRQSAASTTYSTPWEKWLHEDVAYIISGPEIAAFERLTTDPEREMFVQQFWERRDPTPGTPSNEYKIEHYRRIQYVNDHFTASVPGWKTDRGRIYILYGPPNEIESHPSGDGLGKPPHEEWLYKWIEGMGYNAILKFVDESRTGEYHMVGPQAR